MHPAAQQSRPGVERFGIAFFAQGFDHGRGQNDGDVCRSF
jgi:hypothetical protein